MYLTANVAISPVCPPGGTWTGDGTLAIRNVPNVPELLGAASLGELLVCWLVGWLVGLLVGRFVGRSVCWMVGWSVG